MAKKHVTLAAPAAVAVGAASFCGDMTSAVAELYGTFVGTYQLQVSFDGVGFVNQGSALTAPGQVAIPDAATAALWNCTAYTSGTPSATLAGVQTSMFQPA